MTKKLLILLTVLAIGPLASAQVLLSNFSSLATQAYSPFNSTWNGGSPAVDQFTQGAGFASITSVNGGDPDGMGSFDAVFAGSSLATPTSINLTGQNYLQLGARLDAGNVNTAITFAIYDSTFTEIESATILSSALTTSFSTVTAPLVVDVGGGDITNATYFSVAGDLLGGDDFRISFDDLMTENTVPEPAPLALLGIGLGALGLFFYRRFPRAGCDPSDRSR